MKEILKHYDPPFSGSSQGNVVDDRCNVVCGCFVPWDSHYDDKKTPAMIAQEIAAALNKAAEVDDNPEIKELKAEIKRLKSEIRDWENDFLV